MGIYDRDYMKWDDPLGAREGWRPSAPRTATGVIIAINVAVFLLWLMSGGTRGAGGFMNSNFLLSRAHLQAGHVWTLLTYAFSHQDMWHILFNMLFLHWFGRELEYVYGKAEFAVFYLLCALVSGAAHVMLSDRAALGASGSVMGIVVVYAFLYPNRIVLINFLFPVPIKYLAIFYVVMDLTGVLVPRMDNVAHAAHLGGALMGFLYYKHNLRLYRTLRDLFRGGRRPPW